MTSTTTDVLAHIRHWLSRARPDPAPDAALLDRFARKRDDAAFASLVDRHGPMVLGVARRVVGDYHLAEDVFQATFLMLARQAKRLHRPAALPSWLHRTACNLAVTALRARKRRERIEAAAINRVSTSPLDELSSRELLAILDDELRHLPERFRLPLVLCCLEGRSQDEAAALLGWTPGSVKGRLERGRQRLKDRLIRRGLTFAVGAGVPLLLGRPTVAETLRQAALETAREGKGASAAVLALVNGASRSGWKAILCVGLAPALCAATMLGTLRVSSPEMAEETLPPAAAEDKPAPPRVDRHGDPLPQGAVARFGSSRLRVGNAAFALTPDGQAIVTVSPQGVVCRFDAQTGRLLEHKLLTDRADTNPIGQFHARLSADGRIAAIEDQGASGRRVTVWDVSSGKKIFRRASTEKRHTGFGRLSPDGKLLAVVEDEGAADHKQALRVFEVESGRMREIGSLEYNIHGFYFSAGGKRIVLSQTSSITRASTLACFDVAAGKELWRVPNKGGELAVSPDGNTVISDGNSQMGLGFYIIEVDPHSGKPKETFTQDNAAHPNLRMVIAPDNRTLVMNHFGEILLWDIRTRKEIKRFPLPKTMSSGYGPDVGAISPDSRTLVTNVGHLQRWDLTTGKPFFAAPPDDAMGGPIEHLAFLADGKELFASSWSLTSGRWDVATGKRLRVTRERYGHKLIPAREGLRVLHANLHPNPHEVKVSDPVAGKELYTVRWADPKEITINGLRAYAITADGKTLLVLHGEEPGGPNRSFVTACEVPSGRRLARFTIPGNTHYPTSPFSPCGRWVVLNEKVYHVGTGTELFAPADEQGERLAPGDWWFTRPVWFSDDGRLMAGFLRKKGQKTPAEDALAVWELASGAILARIPKVRFVAQVVFAPDNNTIALLDGRGVRLVDLPTGELLATYAAPDVTCMFVDRGCTTQTLAFSPDGHKLATGHEDGTVLLWEVPQPRKGITVALKEAERETLWADLASASPAKARTAVERLARRPDAAMALLAARFRPPPSPPDPALAVLVKDLDNDAFEIREKATRKLREYGAKAEPALRRALAGSPSLEMRRRAEELLAAVTTPLQRLPLSGEDLRGVRAIEVLERIGTSEARKLLRAWAGQTANMRLAAEAKLSIERFDSANFGQTP